MKNVIIDHMRLMSVASQGGVSTFDNIDRTGPAGFHTDHAQQQTSNSRFTGRQRGVVAHSDINQAQLGQGSVEFNVSTPDGGFTGVLVTRIIGLNDPGGPTLSVTNVVKPQR